MTAGHVPCTPEEITISNESEAMGGQTWIATCHGRQYVCGRSQSGSFSNGKGVSGATYQTACSARDDDDPVTPLPPKEKDPGPPVAVSHDGVRFEVPGDFTRDFDAKGEVYRDERHRYAVRLVLADWTGTDEKWVEAHYPDADASVRKINGLDVLIANWVGKQLRVYVAVVVSGGKVYELACSTSDVKESKIPKPCSVTFNSLRIGP